VWPELKEQIGAEEAQLQLFWSFTVLAGSRLKLMVAQYKVTLAPPSPG
jgi:hypothetical protein